MLISRYPNRHTARRSIGVLAATVLGLASALPLSAAAADDEGSVFFCPSRIMAAVGPQSKGIMCDAEHCFNSQSVELSAEQKDFLLSASGQCRYLSAKEVVDFWPKDAMPETQHATK
ncbi:hypothetical protein [Rhodoferax sp.]|uniref:hypothetical protein n=1 Tax=Rhodoferax sp. TaxID=50421 RepID=UPI00374CC6B7